MLPHRYIVTIYTICYKYFKYYLVCALCLYTILWIYQIPIFQHTKDRKSSVNLKYVTVHLDLKGSPPKMSYLESILPMLSKYGVNSILMEYEDTFPYSGSIVNVSSKNCYSREELMQFMNKAKLLNMEIIPLIQTFGHMEFVLKWKEFAHLRENKRFCTDICPSNPASRTLITTMLKQVIDLHNTVQPLKHIHVGCDEVRRLNMCSKCRRRKLKKNTLFIKHVEEVTSIVKELSSGTKVLIWDDMIASIKKEKSIAIDNVDVVSWQYSASPKFIHTTYYNLHKSFKDIWIASAFKGADGYNAVVPNIRVRFKNHLSWMRFILGYKFGGESNVYNFKGIILTGWSRYSHLQTQCELFPVAMPSLILNLLLIKTVKEGIDHGDLKKLNDCEFFNKYLSVEFNKIYRNYSQIDEKCSFENTFIYAELNKLFDFTLFYSCRLGVYQFQSKCSSSGNTNTITLENSLVKCDKAFKKISQLTEYLESFMIKYYNSHVITDYIYEIIQASTEEVKTSINDLKYYCNLNYSIIQKNIYNNVDFVKGKL